jgi:hypothetical protein
MGFIMLVELVPELVVAHVMEMVLSCEDVSVVLVKK